ncbi:MAG: CPXCG motif-containing cysteine-rich protein [Planctomycetota bacterium]|nr:CPXCG motif-containing cysteine-rich protein [Planctomycetota bacterium]
MCDSCGEEIVIPIDYSQGSVQHYVEDCPVCCHPNVIHIDIGPEGELETWGHAE